MCINGGPRGGERQPWNNICISEFRVYIVKRNTKRFSLLSAPHSVPLRTTTTKNWNGYRLKFCSPDSYNLCNSCSNNHCYIIMHLAVVYVPVILDVGLCGEWVPQMALDYYEHLTQYMLLQIFTSRLFLKNYGKNCFGIRRHIRCLCRPSPRFALYLGCYYC